MDGLLNNIAVMLHSLPEIQKKRWENYTRPTLICGVLLEEKSQLYSEFAYNNIPLNI